MLVRVSPSLMKRLKQHFHAFDFGVHCNVDDIGMPTDFLRGMILAMLAITTEFRRLRSWVADFVALMVQSGPVPYSSLFGHRDKSGSLAE